MIIQVRGISGSGKTWVVQQVMRAAPLEPVYIPGRRNPLYYRSETLAVLGSYATHRGGCDTIEGYDWLRSILEEQLKNCGTVLMEGLLLSDDVVQTELYRQLDVDVRAIFLATELGECIRQAETRRAELGRGAGKTDATRAAGRLERLKRARVRLKAAGIFCRSASAQQAVKLILRWIA